MPGSMSNVMTEMGHGGAGRRIECQARSLGVQSRAVDVKGGMEHYVAPFAASEGRNEMSETNTAIERKTAASE